MPPNTNFTTPLPLIFPLCTYTYSSHIFLPVQTLFWIYWRKRATIYLPHAQSPGELAVPASVYQRNQNLVEHAYVQIPESYLLLCLIIDTYQLGIAPVILGAS